MRNSKTIPIKGMPKIAPQIPPKVPPIAKETKTRAGDKSISFLLKTGTKILLSICWIKVKITTAKTALAGLAKNIKSNIKAPVKNGPTIGMKLVTAANNPKENE